MEKRRPSSLPPEEPPHSPRKSRIAEQRQGNAPQNNHDEESSNGTEPPDTETKRRGFMSLSGRWIRALFSVRQRNQVLQIAGIAFSILLIIGIYALWCHLQIQQPRSLFIQFRNHVDESVLRTYAPEKMQEMRTQVNKARKANAFLSTNKVSTAYNEATANLQEATRLTERRRSQLRHIRSRLEKLTKEAQDTHLPLYLPDLWERANDLMQAAPSPSSSDFTFETAHSTLEKALSLLEEKRPIFDNIERYHKARETWSDNSEKWEQGLWEQNIPEAHDSLQEALQRARKAGDAGEWDAGVRQYEHAVSVLEKGVDKITEIQEETEKAGTELTDMLSTEERQAAPQFAPDLWEEFSRREKQIKQEMEAGAYTEAKTHIKDAKELIPDIQNRLTEGRKEGEEQLRKLREEMAEFRKHADVYKHLWPQRVEQLTDLYQAAQNHAEEDNFAQISELVPQITDMIAAMESDTENLDQQAGDLKNEIQSLREKLDPDFCRKNFSEKWDQARTFAENGDRYTEADKLQNAIKAYRSARPLFNELAELADNLREEARNVRDNCREKFDRLLQGMKTFHPDKLQNARSLLTTGENAWENEDLQTAKTKFTACLELLPEKPLIMKSNGVLVDYHNGTKWLARLDRVTDGVDKRTWYQTYSWVRNLEFADIVRWQIPRREQIKNLYELVAGSDGELIVPTDLPDGTYWTSTESLNDIDKVYVFDLQDGSAALEKKSTQHYLLPVYTPASEQ